MSVNNLLKVIKKQRDDGEKKQKFSGTFVDYLKLVEKDPSIIKTSHKRLYESLMEDGCRKMPDSDPRKSRIFDNENVNIYPYFEKHFFGMEKSLQLKE